MTLTRITSMLGAVALGGVLVASTNGAQAAPDRTGHAHHARSTDTTSQFWVPPPHPWGPNGMRLGLHCENHDIS